MRKIVPPAELPLIELDPAAMLLPTVISRIDFSNHPDLLTQARAQKLPYVFLMMSRPDMADMPDRLYATGVVAYVLEADTVEPELTLRGEYRAPLLGINEPDKESYYTVSIGEAINDDKQVNVFAQDDSGQFFITPEYLNKTRSLLFAMNHKIRTLLDICSEFMDPEIELLSGIYDRFNNLSTNRRDIIDELIWNIVFAMPYMEADLKQNFIETLILTNRLTGCVGLLDLNIEVISKTRKIEASSPRTRTRTSKQTQLKSKNGEKMPEDEQFRTDDPELQEKFKKYLEIKKSISNEREREIFVEAAMRDFKKIKSFGPARGDVTEVAMVNNRLDLVLALPWGKETPRVEDFREFEKVFESEHYGLNKIKYEISDYVAVRRNHPDGKGRVLCFVGPPGVGKTSVCKSIARGQGMGYIRVSLGGIRDEAQIRGHRLTYIGALPGCIISNMKTAKAKNVVFVLDEIDKIGADAFRGDPADALLEVLDPEQNHSFTDHYVDAPFDLSKVFFICTANTLAGIPLALRDRMDKVIFSGYTEDTKVEIAKNFLIPKVLDEVGLAQQGFEFKWQNEDPNNIILLLTRGYTKESGVRDLERKLRKIAARIVKKNFEEPGFAEKVIITEDLIKDIHGRPRVRGRANHTDIGEVIGLVVDEVGQGDITYVQAVLSLKTGVMDKSISQTDEEEADLHKSTQRAITVAKNWLEVNHPKALEKLKTHLISVQVSDTFVKTGGPSAGITACIAVISKLIEQEVNPYIAMTGAIALTGRVRAVGGIKEKVIAAANAGVKVLVLPESNRKDYEEDVPQKAKDKLDKVHFVEKLDQIPEIVFSKNIPVA